MKGVLGPISLSSFFRAISLTIFMTFIPVYAVSFGIGPAKMAIISAIGTSFGVIFLPLVGYLTDYFGQKRLMVFSCLIMSLVPIPTILWPSFLGVTLSWILFNIGMFSWMSSRSAKIASEISGSLGASFALVSFVMQIGRTVAPYLAGVSISRWGYDLTFLVGIYLSILSSLIVVLGVKGEEERRGEKFSLQEFLKGLKPRGWEVGFQAFLTLDRFSWRLWMPMMSSYFRAFLMLSPEQIGILGTIRGAISAITMLGAGKLVDAFGWFPMILLSELSGVGAALSLGLGRNFIVLAFGMSLVGLSISSWIPAFNVAVVDLAEDKSELGRCYSRANFYRSAISVPSSFLGGIAYSFGPFLPFVLGASMMLFNSAYLFKVRRRKAEERRREK